MTDALQKEIERLEEEEKKQNKPETDQENQVSDEQDQDEKQEDDTTSTDEAEDHGDTEEEQKNTNVDDAEEERKRIAREKYKERQAQKANDQKRQSELQHKQETGSATQQEINENEQLKKRLEAMESVFHQQQYKTMVKQAEKELSRIEQTAKNDPDFKAAYPDYEQKVANAIEFAKIRLVASGVDEHEAIEQINFEKTLLADRAVAEGRDPLEAIYNEAETINSTFEKFAEKMGYKKAVTKTNLQAQRELSKANALNSGAGKGANAVTRSFDELDDDDMETIRNTRIWDIQ